MYHHNEYPTGQWASRGQEFALQDCYLCWGIVCSECKIIGDIAGLFPFSNNHLGHTNAHRKVTKFLQSYVKLIEDWELKKACILEQLLNKNVHVSTNWHPLLGVNFNPLISILDIC
jgi:hypothetical protein